MGGRQKGRAPILPEDAGFPLQLHAFSSARQSEKMLVKT
jgi:hypothetical protein